MPDRVAPERTKQSNMPRRLDALVKLPVILSHLMDAALAAFLPVSHMLLGLLRVPDSTAYRVLAEAPIDTAGLRSTTDRLIGDSAA